MKKILLIAFSVCCYAAASNSANAQAAVYGFQTDPTEFNSALGGVATINEHAASPTQLAMAYGFDIATSYDWWTPTPGNWELDTIEIKLALAGAELDSATVSIWTGGTNGNGDPFPTTMLSGVSLDTQTLTTGATPYLGYTFTLDVSGALRTDHSPLSGSGSQDSLWVVVQGNPTTGASSPNLVALSTMGDAGHVWANPSWSDNTFASGWGNQETIWKGLANTMAGTFTSSTGSTAIGGAELIGHVKLNFVPVPEPGTGFLLLSSAFAFVAFQRRRKQV
ncbi:MAG: PEP-CTERM sorting domain-containing protein [Chthoniobacterales bacterium]